MNKKLEYFISIFAWVMVLDVLYRTTFWLYDTGRLFEHTFYMCAMCFGWFIFGVVSPWFFKFVGARRDKQRK